MQQDNDKKTSSSISTSRVAFWSHLAPYLLWIAFIMVFQLADSLGNPFPRSWIAPSYALKSLLCAILILVLKPWRYVKPNTDLPLTNNKLYDSLSGNVALGILGGILVAILWIFPETPFFYSKCRALCELYNTWLIMPLGANPEYFAAPIFPSLPEGFKSLAYSPDECGWFLTIAKLLGSAFVIAIAEEYFFRSFLYRWVRNSNFLSIPLSKYDAPTFWIVVCVFALEHDRWFMGAIAGVVYGFIALKSRRFCAPIIAHITTNLILGLYVIISGQYGFW